MIPFLKRVPECKVSLLSPEAAEVLTMLCVAIRPKSIIEIGTFLGCGSTRILAGFADRLLCVDSCTVDMMRRDVMRDELHYHLLLSNLAEYPNVEVLRSSSLAAAEMIENGCADLVFIDGGHSEADVAADIGAWLPKVKSGGIICGDDYQPKFQGVIKAVQTLLPDHQVKDRIWWDFKP